MPVLFCLKMFNRHLAFVVSQDLLKGLVDVDDNTYNIRFACLLNHQGRHKKLCR